MNGVNASGLSSFTTESLGFADLFNDNPTSGSFYLDAMPTTSGAPEPGAFLLAGLGLLALSLRRRV